MNCVKCGKPARTSRQHPMGNVYEVKDSDLVLCSEHVTEYFQTQDGYYA